MSDLEGPGRPSRPEEEPPREQARGLSWLFGTAAGLVGVAFLVIVVVVLLILLFS
jgi:hypothetical protein